MANPDEEREIAQLPLKYQPLSRWAYLGYTLLFQCVPLVGIIMAFVFAFNDSNIARRNFARSFVLVFAIEVVLGIILGLTGMAALLAAGSMSTGTMQA